MKIKFDTYTKDVASATAAYSSLYAYCSDLNLSKNIWDAEVINLHGEIDSGNLSILEKAVPDGTFNEDTDKL